MKPFLKFAEAIDWLTHKFYLIAAVAALAASLISAGNAAIRWMFDSSSNARLEIQWYMFAVCVMFGAAFVLKVNEHVRVDVIYGKLKGRGSVYVDIFGLLVFLLPMAIFMVYLSAPLAMKSFTTQEMSSQAGGLIRWPFFWMVPIGFSLLALQGISEVIKRIGFLTGQYDMNLTYEKPLQ
jgi:TRAP-type mannitol/chloroaromatic compound transport system permease small subunit